MSGPNIKSNRKLCCRKQNGFQDPMGNYWLDLSFDLSKKKTNQTFRSNFSTEHKSFIILTHRNKLSWCIRVAIWNGSKHSSKLHDWIRFLNEVFLIAIYSAKSGVSVAFITNYVCSHGSLIFLQFPGK